MDRLSDAEIAAAVAADPDQFIPDERHLRQARVSFPAERRKPEAAE